MGSKKGSRHIFDLREASLPFDSVIPGNDLVLKQFNNLSKTILQYLISVFENKITKTRQILISILASLNDINVKNANFIILEQGISERNSLFNFNFEDEDATDVPYEKNGKNTRAIFFHR